MTRRDRPNMKVQSEGVCCLASWRSLKLLKRKVPRVVSVNRECAGYSRQTETTRIHVMQDIQQKVFVELKCSWKLSNELIHHYTHHRSESGNGGGPQKAYRPPSARRLGLAGRAANERQHDRSARQTCVQKRATLHVQGVTTGRRAASNIVTFFNELSHPLQGTEVRIKHQLD